MADWVGAGLGGGAPQQQPQGPPMNMADQIQQLINMMGTPVVQTNQNIKFLAQTLQKQIFKARQQAIGS